MGDVPDFADREALANQVTDHEAAELVDFTRNGYRTMWIRAETPAAADELIEAAEDAGFEWTEGDDAMELVFRAPFNGGPDQVSMGGNRL